MSRCEYLRCMTHGCDGKSPECSEWSPSSPTAESPNYREQQMNAAQTQPQFNVSDLGLFSLAEMLETNYHDEDFCEWAKSCPVGASYDGGGEPCERVA